MLTSYSFWMHPVKEKLCSKVPDYFQRGQRVACSNSEATLLLGSCLGHNSARIMLCYPGRWKAVGLVDSDTPLSSEQEGWKRPGWPEAGRRWDNKQENEEMAMNVIFQNSDWMTK